MAVEGGDATARDAPDRDAPHLVTRTTQTTRKTQMTRPTQWPLCARRAALRSLLPLLCLYSSGCSLFRAPVPDQIPVVHTQADAGTFLAGAAHVDITPQRDLWLAGYHGARKSDGVHDPIGVRALVLQRGTTRQALVALDLIGIQRQELLPIFEELGYTAGQLVIACTHTHSAPDTLGLWGRPPFWSGVDDEYFARVKRAIVAAVRAAESCTVAAEVAATAIPLDPAGLQRNRRRPGVEDREYVIVHLRSVEDQSTLATLVEFACHPEAIGRTHNLVTSDYPHYLRKSVESAVGGVAIYVSGALGGLISPDSKADPPAIEWQEMQRIGKHLGHVTVRALQELGTNPARYEAAPRLATWHAPMYIPQENFLYDVARWTGIIDRDLFGDGYILTEVNLWQVGSLRIATVPGEITPDLGLRIKEAVGGATAMLVGLGNDEIGYLLPDLDHALPIYSYERTLCVGAAAGERVTRRLELLGRLARQQEQP